MGGKGERENKYAPAHTVDCVGKNATVYFFLSSGKTSCLLPQEIKGDL